ncbi:hypothetical protein K431DRAFT_75462 [Polychaeton citri CBS 116435]|uniref:Uncharacterized protein n=1 Tax=Polychaeton citri CBS 116435 TaxID=1314669 RepID=A0A9P4Q632_9PEZI|nr:hypothetical protein K431DRAFT_75462 [Polychaeton citri CBS 116435]
MFQSWRHHASKERMLNAVLAMLQTVPQDEPVNWLKVCRDHKESIAGAVRKDIALLTGRLGDNFTWAGPDEGPLKLLWRKFLNLRELDDVQAVFLGGVDTEQDGAQISRSSRLEDHLEGAPSAPDEFIIEYYREANPDDKGGDEPIDTPLDRYA